MTLHLGLPHSSSRTTQHTQQIRDAKRELKEKVREDWDYPALPAYQLPIRRRQVAREDEEVRIAGFRFHTPDHYSTSTIEDAGLPGLHFDPLEWREREYSSDESADSASPASAGSGGSKKGPFRFERPDSVGSQIQDRKAARKRKRQKAMDDEVTWNDGLAHWLARRDAWSGAHTSTQIQLLHSKNDERGVSASPSASAGTTPRTSTSSKSSASARMSSTSTTPELVTEATLIQTRPAAPPSEILVPLAPTILVNHPIRRRITSDIYPEIYSKIIMQSRTPSVPINLATLSKALVQGWKDDGEWPPKPAALEKSIGRKKGGESTLRSGVKAVGRVLRITSGESSVGGAKEKG